MDVKGAEAQWEEHSRFGVGVEDQCGLDRCPDL